MTLARIEQGEVTALEAVETLLGEEYLACCHLTLARHAVLLLPAPSARELREATIRLRWEF